MGDAQQAAQPRDPAQPGRATATSRQVQAVEALDQAPEQRDLPVTPGQAVPREAVQELVRAAAGLNDWAECHSFGLPGASLPLPAGLAGRLRQLRAALEPVCRFLSFGDGDDWELSYPEALAQQDCFLEQ